MNHSRLNNLLILLGLCLLIFGAASLVVDLRKAASFQVPMDVVEQAQATARAIRSQVTASPQPTATPPSVTPTPQPTDQAQVEPQEEQTSTPTAQPTPTLEPEAPVRIIIPSIELDAPVELSKTDTLSISGIQYTQWLAPDKFAAGWHEGSARLGEPGNTVINGHNNIWGKVFGRLEELKEGDTIYVSSASSVFTYVITNHMILPEKWQPLEVRIDNAKWILPSEDERLTLITCWPITSNSHRLIIVAKPVAREVVNPEDQTK